MVWESVPGSYRAAVVDRTGDLFVLTTTGTAKKRISASRNRWFSLLGNFDSLIAHPAVRGIWGIGASDSPESGRAFRHNTSWWVQKGERAFADLTVTPSGEVLGLTTDGRVFRWNERKKRWNLLGRVGDLQGYRLAAVSRRRLWVIDKSGDLLEIRNGKPRKAGLTGLRDLAFSVERNCLYLVDENGRLRCWDPSTGKTQLLARPVKELRLVSVSLGDDGRILVIDGDGNLFAGEPVLPTQVVEKSDVPELQPGTVESEGRPGSPAPTALDQAEQPHADETFRLNLAKVPGTAARVAIGTDGRVFAAMRDGSIAQWSNTLNRFSSFPGIASRLALGPDGEVWAVTATGFAQHFDGKRWIAYPLKNVRDIRVDGQGAVWASDNRERIYRFDRKRRRFKRTNLVGSYFAFDPDGRFWAVRADNKIFRCREKRCQRMPGIATDIVVGPGGLVLTIDRGRRLYRWLEAHGRWDLIRKDTQSVEIGPSDTPWVVDADGAVWASAFYKRDESRDIEIADAARRYQTRQASLPKAAGTTTSASIFTFTKSLKWEQISVEGSDSPRLLWVGPNNGAYLVSTSATVVWEFDADKDEFKVMTDLPRAVGTSVRRIAVGENGRPWFVYNDNQIWRPDGDKNFKQITNFTNANYVNANYGGKIMAVNTSGVLYDYDADKNKFETADDAEDVTVAADFDVDPDGHPWVYTSGGYLKEYTGRRFEFRPEDQSQKFDNVGIGGDGSVYISEEVGGSGRLLKWNESNKDFDVVSTPSGVSVLWVDVAGDGRPWFISTDYKVYRAK